MKAEQIRDLDFAELAAKERETREQLFRLRFQISMGQTDGVKKYRALRRDLARMLTVRGEQNASGREREG